MSVTSISTKNRNLLWAVSGGRCQYEGCNKVLYTDILTKRACNSSYIAHIVADESGGPRGDAVRSPLLKNDISNLMLLCDVHHRMIDIEDIAGHPESRLLEMKRMHEERIRIQTGISPNKCSEIVLYGANIGLHSSPLSYEIACATLSPEFYPRSERAVEIGLINSCMTDDTDTYWVAEEENLIKHVEQQIKTPIRNGEAKHYSVFALAPQPLLIKLGTLLNDLHQVRVYQKHREPDSWKWQVNLPSMEFSLLAPADFDGIPVLILGLSATICLDRIVAVLGKGVSIWHLTVENPNNDCMKTEAVLSEFRKIVRGAFDKIKSRHGCIPLHVFPAMPVAAAVEFGRVWMPKADMPMIIYDQNKAKGGFSKTITIN